MADSVGRIVPPSISIDGATRLGREQQRKPKEDKPRQAYANGVGPAAHEGEQGSQSAELGTGKGKRLDISA